MSEYICVGIAQVGEAENYQELVDAVDEFSHEMATELAMHYFGCNNANGVPVWTTPLTIEQFDKIRDILDSHLKHYMVWYSNIVIERVNINVPVYTDNNDDDNNNNNGSDKIKSVDNDDNNKSGKITGDLDLYKRNIVTHRESLRELFANASPDEQL